MNHIELFAGCGGLSLGLKKAGFKLVLANELSPMAAETYAFNFFKEDFQKKAKQNKLPKSTIWINSQYDDLTSRLRENPFDFPRLGEGDNSIQLINPSELKGKLIVGSIIELNRLIVQYPELAEQLRSGFEGNGIDLVSGGPPCQSFSMAGLRQQDCDKNSLPWEFAEFVSHVQPKIAMLENVTGILRAFRDDTGKSFHAWFEIAKVFAAKGYIPLCLHIDARLVGVAQNRRRFIMIAIKKTHYDRISKSFIETEQELFSSSKVFYEKIQSGKECSVFESLQCFDTSKPSNLKLFKESFLHYLIDKKEVCVREALDDLKLNPSNKSNFVKSLNSTFRKVLYQPISHGTPPNHEQREHSKLVKRRFRIYQVLNQLSDLNSRKAIFAILKGQMDYLSDDVWNNVKNYTFLQPNDNGEDQLKRFKSKIEFTLYLHDHPTKKQTQKALIADAPAPAALSLPDDACHYDAQELRVLTIREMARIQSFPDNFIFKSKITTGGQLRKFEVPQYTQVGNAVPPLLGLRLGMVVKELLNR